VAKDVEAGGNLRIYSRPIPEITLRVPRNGLGPKSENIIDTGTSMDGPDVTSTAQGSVRYFDRCQWQVAGGEVGLSCYFTSHPLPKLDDPSVRRLVDDDVVTIASVTSEHARRRLPIDVYKVSGTAANAAS
jgi:hypothetical protein